MWKAPAPYPGGGLLLPTQHRFTRRSRHMRGTVKWFNNQKGFGFLRPDEGGKDVFVHHTAIKMEGFRSLNEGERVEYDVEMGPKGLQAARVVRIPD